MQDREESGVVTLLDGLEGFTMVGVDGVPFLWARGELGCLYVDEVASASEAAASLFREGVAALGFVRSIVFHVYP